MGFCIEFLSDGRMLHRVNEWINILCEVLVIHCEVSNGESL